jgi:hypothetical protein
MAGQFTEVAKQIVRMLQEDAHADPEAMGKCWSDQLGKAFRLLDAGEHVAMKFRVYKPFLPQVAPASEDAIPMSFTAAGMPTTLEYEDVLACAYPQRDDDPEVDNPMVEVDSVKYQ